MSDGTFTRVEKSSETMYGPRGILACGYSKEEQTAFLSVLEEIRMKDIPVKFPVDDDGSKSLKTILEETETEKSRLSSLRAGGHHEWVDPGGASQSHRFSW